MLNSNIISSICEYLPNNNIAKFHRITKFNKNLQLFDHRLLDEKDPEVSVENFSYLSEFPIRRLKLHLKHEGYFYNRFATLTRFTPNEDISYPDLINILKRCKKLQELYLNRTKNITNLKFIRYCKNLEWLSLTYVNISDISALGSCKNLKSLSIVGIDLHDISALRYCMNLRNLDIISDDIPDISALENCPRLTGLSLFKAGVVHVPALRNCSNIKYLALGGRLSNNISSWANYTDVEVLDLSWANVKDLAFLTYLRKLKALHLDTLMFKNNISAMTDCTSLRILVLTLQNYPNAQDQIRTSIPNIIITSNTKIFNYFIEKSLD
jgi:internalin A